MLCGEPGPISSGLFKYISTGTAFETVVSKSLLLMSKTLGTLEVAVTPAEGKGDLGKTFRALYVEVSVISWSGGMGLLACSIKK